MSAQVQWEISSECRSTMSRLFVGRYLTAPRGALIRRREHPQPAVASGPDSDGARDRPLERQRGNVGVKLRNLPVVNRSHR